MKNGVTIIELLVAITIAGTLASVATPIIMKNIDRPNYSGISTTIKSFENDVRLFYASNGEFAEEGIDLNFNINDNNSMKYFWTGSSLTITLNSGSCKGKSITTTIYHSDDDNSFSDDLLADNSDSTEYENEESSSENSSNFFSNTEIESGIYSSKSGSLLDDPECSKKILNLNTSKKTLF